MTDPHPLDDLLEELLPKAVEVAVAVRDRDVSAVNEALHPLLDPLDLERLKALVIDLAVLVPDDVPFGDLLAWTHGPHVDDDTYRQLAAFDPRPGMRQCTRCEEWWRIEEFHRDRTRPDGIKTHCKSCITEARNQRIAARDTNQSAVEDSAGHDIQTREAA